jgi:dTDP-4-dehydrorhamnose 3,5-epimerase
MNQPILYQPNPADQIAPGVYKTPMAGLYYLPREAFKDERGFYTELVRFPEIEAVTQQPFIAKQLNLSSSKTNVIRGFHAENWDKLLTVVEGHGFCAWADIRPESPTFGQVVTMWVGRGDNAHFGSMFVSKGIANSFCVLDEPLYYLYAVNQLYKERDASGDVAISLFDPDLNVAWPIHRAQMILSDRDNQAITLRQKFPEKFV